MQGKLIKCLTLVGIFVITSPASGCIDNDKPCICYDGALIEGSTGNFGGDLIVHRENSASGSHGLGVLRTGSGGLEVSRGGQRCYGVSRGGFRRSGGSRGRGGYGRIRTSSGIKLIRNILTNPRKLCLAGGSGVHYGYLRGGHGGLGVEYERSSGSGEGDDALGVEYGRASDEYDVSGCTSERRSDVGLRRFVGRSRFSKHFEGSDEDSTIDSGELSVVHKSNCPFYYHGGHRHGGFDYRRSGSSSGLGSSSFRGCDAGKVTCTCRENRLTW